MDSARLLPADTVKTEIISELYLTKNTDELSPEKASSQDPWHVQPGETGEISREKQLSDCTLVVTLHKMDSLTCAAKDSSRIPVSCQTRIIAIFGSTFT